MANYIEFKLLLTENQKKKINRAITKKESVSFRLTKQQVNQDGDSPVLLTKTQANKILKAKQKGTGVDIELSSAQVKSLAKQGGFLPLIPLILGGISAIGSLAGGASAIAKAVHEKKAKDQELVEQERHNKEMEIALKSGTGIKVCKSCHGTGLFLGKRPPV